MLNNQHALAIANGEPPSLALISSHLKKGKKLVAIDGGLKICKNFDLIPDFILGDFDSASKELLTLYGDSQKIQMPSQDKCDLEKALDYLFSSGCLTVTVLGATGRRTDHVLMNLSLLCRYPLKVVFETDCETLFALTASFQFSCKIGQTLSLIPFGEVRNVHTTGLKWNLNGDRLGKEFLSLSNIALQENIFISFKEGDLILCLIKEQANEKCAA